MSDTATRFDADALLGAIQSRGSDATTLRDAAHEACHAVEWRVTKRWTRDNIHRRKPRARVAGIRSEILARAVEQLVCQRCGVDCGTVEKWAMVCCMEMVKNERISLPGPSWLAERVKEAMATVAARDLADRVCALGAVAQHQERDNG